MRQVYYFGVWPGTRAGHYLRDKYDQQPRWWPEKEMVIPWGYEVDGGLCPFGEDEYRYSRRPDTTSPEMQGLARITEKDGWTALAFWDSSEDQRGACNSVFFIDETGLGFDELVAIFRKEFPALWARFDAHFTVRLEDKA